MVNDLIIRSYDLIIRQNDLIIRYKTIIFISLKSASTKALRIGNMLNNHMRRHRHYHSALARYIDANCTIAQRTALRKWKNSRIPHSPAQ